jgi:uncharacterized protein (TIGR02246 family)
MPIEETKTDVNLGNDQCSSVGPQMSREDATDLVRRMEQAVNAHDTERLLAFYAEEAVMVSPVFGEVPGRDAIGKSYETTFSLFPDWTVKVTDVLVDGNRIGFVGTAAATDRKGWFGQAATGERIDYRAVIVLTMAHGKIIRDERIYDLAGVLRLLEKARLDKELRMAAEVQHALLSRARHSTAYCDAVGDSLPCRAIGGDFFELVALPSGDFGIALGDVAGKGPASALLAAMIQGMLTVEIQIESSPAAILTHLNRSLTRRALEPRFATLVYGVLSPDGGFVYANAGHNPPMVVTREGLRRLAAGGPILGAFGDSKFEEDTIRLSQNDTIIMFSDGVTEARDAHDSEFGEGGLISYVTASRAKPATDILDGILKNVQDFCRGTTQSDDVTVTVTRYHGCPGSS